MLGALAAGGVSGVGMALAFPPADWGPLAFIALVPLALVFRRAGAVRGRKGQLAIAATAFGLSFFALLLPWLHLFGLAAYLLVTVIETGFVVAALMLGVFARRHLPGRWALLAFPVAFLVGEYARSHIPVGGFPWGGLGYSQHNNPAVLHLAAYTGVWGVSFLIATVNALVAEAAAGAWAVLRHRPAGLAAWSIALPLVLAAALIPAPALLPVPTPHGAPATIALVQGNAPNEDPADPHALDQAALDDQVAETQALAGRKVDLVVWPESSVGHDPFTDPALLDPLLASIRATGAPFIVGATVPAPAVPGSDGHTPRFRNESLYFSATGSLLGRYVKMHLVPFGEYVPGRRWLAGWIKELDRVPADGIPGTSPTVFRLAQTPGGWFASVICYETAYPELVQRFVAHGARLIIVSTDNSSYARSAASAQMVAISQLRAAEERMWVTQAAITGISAVIAPDGRVVAQTGLFRPALLTPTVRFATTTTLYGRFGDWFPVLVLLIGTALAIPWRPRGAGIAAAGERAA
ncbi:MAG TPA: apolipoprotein N-acyltransferase [Actinomycetota bacterium]|nr:apolipoprotein N-acyltransferase [Actinomycetota bacterium]